MKLNPGQQEIVAQACSPLSVAQREQLGGHLISVPAVAGSGKSVVIIALARRLSDKKILFLCHGRNVADRARNTLPGNVYVSTVAAMALSFLGKTHSAKLKNRTIRGNLSNEEMFSAAPIDTNHNDLLRARRILGRFYVSGDRFPERSNVPPLLSSNDSWVENSAEVNKALEVARAIWFSQCSREKNSAPLTYPAALKLWTQSHAENHYFEKSNQAVRISPLGEYDIVVIEEAQDSSEALLDFLSRRDRHATLLFGDPFQALNSGDWRIQHLNHPIHRRASVVHMQESWRFGPSVASILNALTAKAGNREAERVIGLGYSNVYTASKRYEWELKQKHYTFIAKSWPSLFQVALDATRQGKTIAWVDGIESYPIILLRDLIALDTPYNPAAHEMPPHQQIQTPWIQRCRNLAMAKELSIKRNNHLYIALCDWVELNKSNDLLIHINNWREADKSRQKALLEDWENPPHRDITLTTVDRAKGNEFHRVVVADELVPMRALRNWKINRDDWLSINEAYTAISRAQYEVAIPEELISHLRDHNWELRANNYKECEPIPHETKAHPYFESNRQIVLEMTPLNRGKRRTVKEPLPKRSQSTSYPTLREKVEQGAKAYSQYSVDELRSTLLPRRHRRRQN